MQLIEPNHPFYRPLWRRAVIVAVCLGWAVVEVSTGEPFWAILVGAVGIYAAWVLLVNYDPKPPEPASAPAADDDDEDEKIDDGDRRDG
jgi:hypothetical protein